MFCHLLQQRALAITFPLVKNDAVGRYKRVARDSTSKIAGTYSRFRLAVTPIIPCHRVMLRCFTPTGIYIRGNADHLQATFVFFGNLFHFGKCRNARPTTSTPYINQNIFSFQFAKRMLVAIQIIEFAVNQRLANFCLSVFIISKNFRIVKDFLMQPPLKKHALRRIVH